MAAKKKRKRDYRAEYARRIELEEQRARKEGRKFDRTRARGHGKHRIVSRIEKLNLTKAPYEPEVDVNDVIALAKREGWDSVEEALDRQEKMNQAWLRNDVGDAHELWIARNEDIPEWLYHYHGFFN